MKNFKEALTYDDVLLTPQYSDIKSRKQIKIKNLLDNNICLDLPIISSPMDTVTETKMAIAMAKAGGLGIIHRYNTIKDQSKMVRRVHEELSKYLTTPQIGAAIGVSNDYWLRAASLVNAGATILCIDVAHGHHILVEKAIKTLRGMFHDDVHIMAGNVATAKGFYQLGQWGADSVRCNVGGGSICSTRVQTGHGVPGLQTIMECANINPFKVKIIADGGIRTSGDAVKALAAGADFIMLGSLLAGTDEAPGETLVGNHGTKEKVYRGMASKEAQFDWKNEYSSNEGISTRIPYRGKVAMILADLKNGMTSGLSYSGARTIRELQEKAHFIRQTEASQIESSTHILGSK